MIKPQTPPRKRDIINLLPLVMAFCMTGCGDDTDVTSSMTHDSSTEPEATAATPLNPDQQFLVDNAARAAVSVTETGLQYEKLTDSTGPKPTAQSHVTVHYVGTLINGVQFDSSFSRNEPSTFSLNRVIRGWQEGLQLMSIGSRYRFVVPAKLAYGDAGAGSLIAPGATLVFVVDLLEINSS